MSDYYLIFGLWYLEINYKITRGSNFHISLIFKKYFRYHQSVPVLTSNHRSSQKLKNKMEQQIYFEQTCILFYNSMSNSIIIFCFSILLGTSFPSWGFIWPLIDFLGNNLFTLNLILLVKPRCTSGSSRVQSKHYE